MQTETFLCFLSILVTQELAQSCPEGWTSAPGNKCYKVYVDANGDGHGHFLDCEEYCNSAAPVGQTAALACITSKVQNDAVVTWMNEDSIEGIPGRRSTRYFFWIGNYQEITDQGATKGWTGCVSGEANNGFTAWSSDHISPDLGAQPDDRGDTIGAGSSEDCAAITADGWYDYPCSRDGEVTMYCMCELGASWVRSPGDPPPTTSTTSYLQAVSGPHVNSAKGVNMAWFILCAAITIVMLR